MCQNTHRCTPCVPVCGCVLNSCTRRVSLSLCKLSSCARRASVLGKRKKCRFSCEQNFCLSNNFSLSFWLFFPGKKGGKWGLHRDNAQVYLFYLFIYFKKVENGDYNVITPKFIAFSGPSATKTEIFPGVYSKVCVCLRLRLRLRVFV